MTTGYAFISIIALVCYVFLLLTFMAAKKQAGQRLYVGFGLHDSLDRRLLFVCGHCCGLGLNFWYDVSILGLTLAPYAFFCSVRSL